MNSAQALDWRAGFPDWLTRLANSSAPLSDSTATRYGNYVPPLLEIVGAYLHSLARETLRPVRIFKELVIRSIDTLGRSKMETLMKAVADKVLGPSSGVLRWSISNGPSLSLRDMIF